MARLIDGTNVAHMTEGFSAALPNSTGTVTLVCTIDNLTDGVINAQTKVRVEGSTNGSDWASLHEVISAAGVYTFMTQSGLQLRVKVEKFHTGDKFHIDRV